MKMSFRWYGKDDKIPLQHIAQIPNLKYIVTALHQTPVGEVWDLKDLQKLKQYVQSFNLKLEVIESVNIHESIKIGEASREKYIENYILTLQNLSEIGVKVVCYNFMPIFDWTRTNLKYQLKDKSTTLNFNYQELAETSPQELIKKLKNGSSSIEIPGWEKNKLNKTEELFKKYQNITEDVLFENLQYFLQKIIPVAEKCNIKMAIHPDDPPFSIFNLPRIASSLTKLQKIIDLVPSKNNGLTLCTGSLAPDTNNNILELIKHFGKQKKIFFTHIRNIKITSEKSFYETSHFSDDGNLDLFEIINAYSEIKFNGYIRPDHGRMIWGEKGMPGYGLYDRALGLTYLNGLIEAVQKINKINEH